MAKTKSNNTDPTQPTLDDLARKAASTRRAADRFAQHNTNVLTKWAELQAKQVAAEDALKARAREVGSNAWPKLGLEVTVTPATDREVDVAALIEAVPALVRFNSKKKGRAVVVRLAGFDAAVDAGLVPDDVHQRVVTYMQGTARVSVTWTEIK